MRSRCVGTGAASGGESGVVAGGVGGALMEAGRAEVVEPRRPNAKVATREAKEAPKRRTRRTHCEQPVGSLGAMGLSLPRVRFGYACVL